MAIPAVNIAPSRRAGATRAAGRVLASVLGSSQGRPGLGARPESATGHDRRARRRAGGRRSSLTSRNPAILASKGCGYARSLTRRVRSCGVHHECRRFVAAHGRNNSSTIAS